MSSGRKIVKGKIDIVKVRKEQEECKKRPNGPIEEKARERRGLGPKDPTCPPRPGWGELHFILMVHFSWAMV